MADGHGGRYGDIRLWRQAHFLDRGETPHRATLDKPPGGLPEADGLRHALFRCRHRQVQRHLRDCDRLVLGTLSCLMISEKPQPNTCGRRSGFDER
jgi:hypothetical protein